MHWFLFAADTGDAVAMSEVDYAEGSGVMNANEQITPRDRQKGVSFPTTPLFYPLLFAHHAIREDVAWPVLAGRIGPGNATPTAHRSVP